MADTIVMIHGMWGGGWYWENFKRYFEQKGYQCVTPILRYHDINPGEKPDPGPGTTSLLDYAQDLEEYISTLDEKPILMGHSMGGLISQILGARDLAKALILLTPASPSGINALKYSVIRSFFGIMTKWGFWRKPHRISYKAAVYSMLSLLPEEDRKAVYERFVYESGTAAFEIGFWLLDSSGASKVDETKVNCPVLVVSGKEDKITPASVVKRVAEKYEAVSTYREFENHAHWVIGEPGWEAIAEFISDWLSEPNK
ncbi:MAG: alpha/beta hydrolase [Deltaproteobacteria bacterium]|nr:alpha/beta hydrolase [Deltaproteobacteria bacterium]MBW1897049.1 alpha/beta hydrolase [Deltaproteobacteria bacterium]